VATSPGPNKAKVNRAGRLRRRVGWTLLTLGVLVAGVWGASGWCRFRLGNTRQWLACSRGCLVYGQSGSVGPPVITAWTAERQPPGDVGFEWWFDRGREAGYQLSEPLLRRVTRDEGYGDDRERAALLWPIPLLVWTPAALLLRSGILARRRANTGACGKCGYSLAGLAEGSPCPECGRKAAATA
jgi:hypothetical protein